MSLIQYAVRFFSSRMAGRDQNDIPKPFFNKLLGALTILRGRGRSPFRLQRPGDVAERFKGAAGNTLFPAVSKQLPLGKDQVSAFERKTVREAIANENDGPINRGQARDDVGLARRAAVGAGRGRRDLREGLRAAAVEDDAFLAGRRVEVLLR